MTPKRIRRISKPAVSKPRRRAPVKGAKPARSRAARGAPARASKAAARPARAKRGAQGVPVRRFTRAIVVPRGTPPFDPSELSIKPGERRTVPVLPVRHTVLFPLAILPLNIGRPSSVTLVNECMAGDRMLAAFSQREPNEERPNHVALHDIGTLTTIVRMVRSGEHLAVLVQGLARVKIVRPVANDPYLTAEVEVVGDAETADLETEALAKNVVSQFERVVVLSPNVPDEAVGAAREQSSPGRVGDFIASLLELPSEDKQRLLAALDVKQRLKHLNEILARELQVLEVGAQIQESVKESLGQHQKEFVLRQQMEAIRKELGEGDDSKRELNELAERVEKAQMPPDVRKEADRELARLGRIPAQAAEYTVARTYLEWLCDMPWAVTTEDNLDLAHVRAVLDEDHYGLDKIKERILEYLVVRRFKADARTPILCFAGPPGTGKTSLGRSIARALGRKFVHQSLGGVRDEAEIRGHRRTYIGALPGNIIRGIRRAGSRNPLFILDEIDKLGADFRGDPSSALLEVLDPQQNSAFVDHYLDVPFDLSQVMFLTTANYLDPVPPALRDRMEVIEMTGYTDGEKIAIAKRHLIPKALRENGLEALGLSFSDEAIATVAADYTREAGLRNLDRELQNVLRKATKRIAEGKEVARAIGPAAVHELLGPPRFEDERIALLDAPGAALGLAWTPVGGEVLTIEATAMPGQRELTLTGQLGDVMRESAQAALSYIRSHANALGIDPAFFDTTEIHVHLPAGAIPKDGPSAGVALCTAMVSLLTRRKPRPGIAMTGEITLRGHVLKVGGIKEKVLGAHRAGIKTVILPALNQVDLDDVPIDVRTHMIFAPIQKIEQALELALETEPMPVPVPAAAGVTPGNGGGPIEGEPSDGRGEPPGIVTESVVARERGKT